jgi:hypothetical protein
VRAILYSPVSAGSKIRPPFTSRTPHGVLELPAGEIHRRLSHGCTAVSGRPAAAQVRQRRRHGKCGERRSALTQEIKAV